MDKSSETEPKPVEFINQKQLADRWGISERTLEYWRWRRIGPSFLKLGSRAIYRMTDVEEFERNQLQTTSQEIVPQYRKSVQLTPYYQKKMAMAGAR